MSPPGRPKGEYRSAPHEGSIVNPPGRPKGEHRSAQHEGGPVRIALALPAPAHNARRREQAVHLATLLVTFGVASVLVWPLWSVLQHGGAALSLEFISTAPTHAGRSGGIAPVIVSTALIVAVSLAASLPLALCTAVLLNERLAPGGPLAIALRGSLDALAGVPSIIFGLFGLSFFCRYLGMGYSIMAGGLTLGCMILPTLARVFGTALESLGDQYRLGGSALGLSRGAVLWQLTLPMALPALCAGVVLALARGLAETAVLLFTSGYADRMPESLADSGRSLSVHIYELATNVPGGTRAAYGSALVLLLALGGLSAALHAGTGWVQGRLLGSRVRVVAQGG